MAYSISTDFAAALTASKQTPISKVEILDGMTRVPVEVITSIDDGSVTVDSSRGTRRTFQLRLPNPQGVYTPVNSNSSFAFSRLVRISRGLRFALADGTVVDELVPLGVFMPDRPETFVERGMSVVTIDGSDLWKKIGTGGFGVPQSFAAGTPVNTVIAAAALDSGVQPRWLNLDPMTGRVAAATQLGAAVQWEVGDNRSDFLTNLATQWGIELFFNADGLLTSRDLVDPDTAAPVWTFATGPQAIMLGVTKTWNDLKLFNHVIVTGECSTVQYPIRYEIKDTDPNSPTNTDLIGDRVMTFVGPQVYGNDQAKAVAQKLFLENCLIEESVKLPTICLPHLEANDVFEVSEPGLSKVSSRYLAKRFDIPLRESRQAIEATRGRAVPA